MSKVGTKIGRVGGGLVLGLLLGGCLTDPTFGGGYTGHVTVEVQATAAPRNHAAVVPDLEKLVVTMTSSGRDTVYDTITSQGSQRSTEPAWLDGAGGNVHLFARYELKAGRRWTVAVKTLDRLDSVVHEERALVEGLRDFEYRAVRLDMAPRWVGYAVRVALPAAMVAGGVSRTVRFSRVELLIDGVSVRDSQASVSGARFFGAGAVGGEIVLGHPYVAPGARTIDFRAHGYIEGDTVGVTPPRLLLTGRTTLNAGLAKAATEESASLEWTAAAVAAGLPGLGDSAAELGPVSTGLQFRIGAIGIVTMNVIIPGAIDI